MIVIIILLLGIGTVGNDWSSHQLLVWNYNSYKCCNILSRVVNSKTIKLYQTLSDYNAGINTVGFTTTNKIGIHKFKL